MLSLFDLTAVLLVLAALFAWVNAALLRLPGAVGVLLLSLAASLAVVGLEAVAPGSSLYEDLRRALAGVDFREAVLGGLLAFLLFAGALTVDLSLLRERAWVVGTMASLGVVLSTALVGAGFWALSHGLGPPVPLVWCLVFGALISPTDPVAVLGMLKAAGAPASLENDMAGESLFNDGVGVVLFAALLAVATGGGEGAGLAGLAGLLLREALGGAALGLLAGALALRAIRRIDEPATEVLITLGLVAGAYALAGRLGVSGPIAMVAAGILVGDRGPRDAMSASTQRQLFGFWRLVDEVLNALLFLLIGIEVLVAGFDLVPGRLALAAIPLAVLARLLAVGGSVALLDRHHAFVPGTVAALTWGGLRGGISIALALSLPAFGERPALLASAYAVVVFTVVVQGLTFGRLLGALGLRDRP